MNKRTLLLARIGLARIGLAVVAALLAAELGRAQQASRASLDAKFRAATQACREATDSGSLRIALGNLDTIAAQDPNYPNLKTRQEQCQEEYKKQLNAEELLFEQAKQLYNRGAYDDAKTKFQSLVNRNTAHAAAAKNYLSLIANAASPGTAGGPAAASEKDFKDLEDGKRHYLAKNYSRARQLLQPLVGKAGTGAEAKKYLDLMESQENNMSLIQKGIQARLQKRCQEALNFFLQIQQTDPNFYGLRQEISKAQECLGTPAATATPATPAAPAAEPASKKSEAAIKEQEKNDRIERWVKQGEALLARKEFVLAQLRFRSALREAPDDEDIRKLLRQAEAGMKQAGQTDAAARAAAVASLLADGIRDFYAGNLSAAGPLFEQYISENGKLKAVAYFYLGAAACTEYYLEGEKNQARAAQAQRYFSKVRQADARFDPPRDWISPKIMAMYERTRIGP